MNRGMRWILLLLLWVAALPCCLAQNPAEMRGYDGHVSDESGNVVEYATAVLLRDGVQTGGAVTDGKGNFCIKAEAGVYQLVVRCVVYYV